MIDPAFKLSEIICIASLVDALPPRELKEFEQWFNVTRHQQQFVNSSDSQADELNDSQVTSRVH